MGNSDHVLSVSIDFLSNSKHDLLFHCIAYDYSGTDWKSLCNHLGDVPWEDIFKFSAFATVSEFFDWVQVGIGVYFPHRKYQIKPHPTPWFSAAYVVTILHRNHFFLIVSTE